MNPPVQVPSRRRLLSLLALGWTLAGLTAYSIPPSERPLYVEGEVLVELNQGISDAHHQGKPFKNCTIRKGFKQLSIRSGHAVLLLQDKSRTTEILMSTFRADPDVLQVSPNYYKYTTLSGTPDDPGYGLQWGLHNTGQTVNSTVGSADADIDFPEARRLSSDSVPEVVIAVIDTGADLEHPDLINRLWVNTGEIPGNGIDDDANGYIDDIHGYDFAGDEYIAASGTTANDGPDNNPNDIHYHGTHVSGIAAAEANNATGGAGISRAKIMVLKASADGNTLQDADILAALEYATEMASRGVNIVAANGSYASTTSNPLEITALTELADEGVIFCAAAGNEHRNNNIFAAYPASYTTPGNIIAVAATDSSDELASFSNYGSSSVDLAAPGDTIYSTYPAYYDPDVTVELGSTDYPARAFSFTGTNVTLNLPFYDCGIGDVGDFPPQVSGNIALIERGTLNFSVKVENAMAAGAVGVIIYNKVASSEGDDGLILGTLGHPNDWIPTVSVSRNSGLALLPSAGTEITLSIYASTDAYVYLSGTSMATPMVTGAVAVLAEHYPDDTMAERMQRLLNAVDVLASLDKKLITAGRLNLANALDVDRDEIPDWYEATVGTTASIDDSTDSDGDGQTDLWEFRAGTDAGDPNSRFAVTESTIDASNVLTLKWPSADGRIYQLYATDSLDKPFTLVQSSIASDPPVNTLHIPIREGVDKQFYQVELIW